MNFLSHIDWWTLCIAALCAASCGMIGTFLVIRRMSLLGDAISHSVLPGLGAAFILAGTRSPAAMLAGALAAGVLTAALAAGVRRIGRLPHDAALGVVFTTLFALGVLMVTWVAKSIDLDPSCVLYGLLELVSLDRIEPLGVSVPRALPWQVGLFAGNLLLIALLFKELRITSFDPQLATALGIHAGAVQAVLLTAVTATTVVSFEAVGSILVVALLVAGRNRPVAHRQTGADGRPLGRARRFRCGTRLSWRGRAEYQHRRDDRRRRGRSVSTRRSVCAALRRGRPGHPTCRPLAPHRARRRAGSSLPTRRAREHEPGAAAGPGRACRGRDDRRPTRVRATSLAKAGRSTRR